jgi:hypothetical protein
MYDVGTWVDRTMLAQRAADKLEHWDCVRVTLKSLRELESKRPELALPEHIPATHRDEDEVRRAAARDEAQQDPEHDDPPPPIGQGWERVEWSLGGQVSDFLIWTKLGTGRGAKNEWHRACVTKTFSGRGPYTHDARFRDGIRGVSLTHDAYVEGCWVPIGRIAEPAREPAPARRKRVAPARGRAPARATRDAPEREPAPERAQAASPRPVRKVRRKQVIVDSPSSSRSPSP